jgi:phosphate/phosphite/phosphonate ABC transporter binding protein
MRIGFAVPVPPTKQDAIRRVVDLGASIEERTGFAVESIFAESYAELVALVDAGDAQLAWLPPIPFLVLEDRGRVTPLVAHRRDGAASYESVLVAPEGSSIRELAEVAGARVGWVDPLSASGYVVPRFAIHEAGVEPGAQRFFGSHEAVLDALGAGAIDVAATYGRVDEARRLVRARGPAMTVLARLGTIPGDVTGVDARLEWRVRDALERALHDVAATQPTLVREVLGVDELYAYTVDTYEVLRETWALARANGLLAM